MGSASCSCSAYGRESLGATRERSPPPDLGQPDERGLTRARSACSRRGTRTDARHQGEVTMLGSSSAAGRCVGELVACTSYELDGCASSRANPRRRECPTPRRTDSDKVELAQVHGSLTSSSLRFAGASHLEYNGVSACKSLTTQWLLAFSFRLHSENVRSSWCSAPAE